MALRTKTIEVPLETNTAAVAAGVAHTWATKTIYIPETDTRTFLSVTVKIYIRGNETVAASATSNAIGVQLAAVAFSDVTQTVTQTNTGDQQSAIYTRDLTSYFVTNFGAGASQTVNIRTTTAVLATIGHCGKLIITYRYEDAPAGVPIVTRVKTVSIPLESNTAQLTATLASIGTNQVPLLDTFLPEAGKVFRAIWFESCANDAGNATTDFQLGMRLDAEAEVLFNNHEQALNSGVYYENVWIRNDMDTSATHDLQARSTLASRFSLLTVILKVTYEYDHSTSTRVINSLVLPAGDDSAFPGNTTTADQSRFQRIVWVQEPGTITMVQSGVVGVIEDPAAITLNIQVGAQSASRAYALTAGSVESGPRTFGHRIDSGSAVGAWGTLARGRNLIDFDWWTTALAVGSNYSSTLYLNYTSDIHSDGDGAHNHSTCFALAHTFNSNSTVQRNIAAIQVVQIPETNWYITGYMYELMGWRIAAAVSSYVLETEHQSGEGPGAGWETLVSSIVRTDGELSAIRTSAAVRDNFNRWAGDPDPDRMSNLTTRQYRLISLTAINTAILVWLTHHSITSQRVTDVTNAGPGTVTLHLCRTGSGERVLTATRTGDGTVTWTWWDNTEDMYIEAVDSLGVARRSEDFLFP